MPCFTSRSNAYAKLGCLLLISSLLLLSACAGGGREHGRGASSRSDLEAANSARLNALKAWAYAAAEPSDTLNLALQQWTIRGEALPVSLAFPGRGQALPLLIYLPGLGETAQAGSVWRQAWAHAGYAVLSLQPLAGDATAWSSELARAADFKGLAREHRRADWQEQRLKTIEAAVGEAQARAAAGDSWWSRVDFNRLAVAGYELGARTAQALLQNQPQAGHWRAAILLSPELAVADPAARSGPLLAISSLRDADPTGWLESAAQRTAVFDQLPALDQHYLLRFDKASHAALAGAAGDAFLQTEAQLEPHANNGGGRTGGGTTGSASAGRRGRGGGMSGGGERRGGDNPQKQPNANANANANAAESLNAYQETVQTVQYSSIAFLDAHVREQARARQWLLTQAPAPPQGLAIWRMR